MITIGIDLGTRNSAAAWASPNGMVSLISSSYGGTIQGNVFPSFIRYESSGRAVKWGEEAYYELPAAPEFVIWGTKRLIGRTFSMVESQLWRFGYRVIKDKNGAAVIDVGDARLAPEDVARDILKWIKSCADTRQLNPFLDEEATAVVITHPAYFDAIQIQKTKEAALNAGFREAHTVAEPIAATIAYGLELPADELRYIFAIDWGAGTLDLASMALRNVNGLPKLDSVQPSAGNVDFGGIDMDDALVRAAIRTYPELAPLAPYAPPERRLGELPKPFPSAPQNLCRDMNRLRSALEMAKIELSKTSTYQGFTTILGKALQIRMVRTENDQATVAAPCIVLEKELKPLLDDFEANLQTAVMNSGLDARDYHNVILIGGPMHMPCARERVRRVFENNPAVVRQLENIAQHGFPVNPMEAVARGAALYRKFNIPVNDPFAYGVALGSVGNEQGMILIKPGNRPGAYDCELPLSIAGEPGDRIPVGLYKREDVLLTGKEKYTRLGEFWFAPVFSKCELDKTDAAETPKNMAMFCPSLDLNRDRTITLRIRDLIREKSSNSAPPMELTKLDKLSGEEIDKPKPFNDPGVSTPFPPLGPKNPPVPREKVEAARDQATIVLADAKRRLARVKSGSSEDNYLIGKMAEIKVLLNQTPPGDCDPCLYQDLGNRTEELKAAIQTRSE